MTENKADYQMGVVRRIRKPRELGIKGMDRREIELARASSIINWGETIVTQNPQIDRESFAQLLSVHVRGYVVSEDILRASLEEHIEKMKLDSKKLKGEAWEYVPVVYQAAFLIRHAYKLGEPNAK